MTSEPKGGKLPERVAKLEQKNESDATMCEEKHSAENARIKKLEDAMWGVNRDGEGGIVNKLNNTILKVALLTGLTSFCGSAIGFIIIQHLARKAGVGG